MKFTQYVAIFCISMMLLFYGAWLQMHKVELSSYILDKSQYECQGRDVTPDGVRCLAYVSKHSEVTK